MPPSTTDITGNPRVPREASRPSRAPVIYTATSRQSPGTTNTKSTYVKDTMCQITAMPNNANNSSRNDDADQYYETTTHNRGQIRRQCSDSYDAITQQSSDNYDAPSRNLCSPEPHTIASLYPPANPFYYNAPPPPPQVTAYYTSSITPPHIPQHFATSSPSLHCVTPPLSMCYAGPPTPPPTEPPGYYRSMGSPPYEVPTHYAFPTTHSTSPPPSEVPVYYPSSPTPPPVYQRSTPISPPLSSPPPLIRTTRPPLQPPILTDIPAPEWREVTPCYHDTTPPPAHLQNTQSPRPLLWRIESEGSMNLKIWDERTQDLATISFQSIVEALDEHRRKEAVDESFIQQHPTPIIRPQEVVIQDEVVIEKIEDYKPSPAFPSEHIIVPEPTKEHIQIQNNDKGKSLKEEGISMFIKNIDNVIADSETRVKDANSEFIPKLELKEEEDESMEVSTSSGSSQTTTKVKLSNSERCRLFREKRLKKMKTNEAILKQLEKRNKILKETERMLIESKELSQKNCLKVMRGRGSL